MKNLYYEIDCFQVSRYHGDEQVVVNNFLLRPCYVTSEKQSKRGELTQEKREPCVSCATLDAVSDYTIVKGLALPCKFHYIKKKTYYILNSFVSNKNKKNFLKNRFIV